METWECKGRALLRYGRNVVLDLRLNRRETSKDGSGLCTQRARKQTLSRGLLWLRTVSKPGEKFSGLGGRKGAGVSLYLPSLVSEGALPSVPWRESSGKDGITKCFLSLVNWHSGMYTPFSPLLHCMLLSLCVLLVSVPVGLSLLQYFWPLRDHCPYMSISPIHLYVEIVLS